MSIQSIVKVGPQVAHETAGSLAMNQAETAGSLAFSTGGETAGSVASSAPSAGSAGGSFNAIA